MIQVRSELKKQGIAQCFIQALLLSLLLNLSGHMFLHLSDAVLDVGETHFTSHEESRSTSAPQHQCSFCQDSQQLVFDSPPTASVYFETKTLLTNPRTEAILAAPSFQNLSNRAPPLS